MQPSRCSPGCAGSRQSCGPGFGMNLRGRQRPARSLLASSLNPASKGIISRSPMQPARIVPAQLKTRACAATGSRRQRSALTVASAARRSRGWIRRYQSGSLHPATFQLVLAWRRTNRTQPASPSLVRASAAFLAEALGRDNRGLLRQFVRIERFFRARQELGRAAYGHLHRWKVHLLLYVLNHPKPCYRTRDLTAYLATKRIRVSGKLIRRFCTRHGIARDSGRWPADTASSL